MGLCCCRALRPPSLSLEPSIPIQELPQGNLDFVDNVEDPQTPLLPDSSHSIPTDPNVSGPPDTDLLRRMLAEVDEMSD
jgi:hypothetical protein